MTNESLKQLVDGLRYRDNLLDLVNEEVTQQLEEIYAGGRLSKCYVPHATNRKPVLMGPFRDFVFGFLASRRENEGLASKISFMVSKDIEQCASWTNEIQVRDRLLKIFIKSMTAASKAWFPKPMIEAKEISEELLNG